MKIEKIDGTLHRRIYLPFGLEYEKDYEIIYLNLYFLKWKISWRKLVKNY